MARRPSRSGPRAAPRLLPRSWRHPCSPLLWPQSQKVAPQRSAPRGRSLLCSRSLAENLSAARRARPWVGRPRAGSPVSPRRRGSLSALPHLHPHPYSVSATILASHRRAGSVGVAILTLKIVGERSPLRAALSIPCYVDQISPEVGVSVVRVLRRLGVEVIYPEGQTCCGQPAFNSGFFDEARTIGRHFLDVFEAERFDYIVCPSGSCTTMVSHYYPFIFKDLPE